MCNKLNRPNNCFINCFPTKSTSVTSCVAYHKSQFQNQSKVSSDRSTMTSQQHLPGDLLPGSAARPTVTCRLARPHRTNHQSNKFNAYHVITSSLLSFCYLSAFLLQTCQAVGLFELRLDHYANEREWDASGACCSRTTSSVSSSSATPSLPSFATKCSTPCQTYFRVCFYNYHTKLEPQAKCSFGEKVVARVGGKSLQLVGGSNTTSNSPSSTSSDLKTNSILRFPFNFTWPVSFTLCPDHRSSSSIS